MHARRLGWRRNGGQMCLAIPRRDEIEVLGDLSDLSAVERLSDESGRALQLATNFRLRRHSLSRRGRPPRSWGRRRHAGQDPLRD